MSVRSVVGLLVIAAVGVVAGWQIAGYGVPALMAASYGAMSSAVLMRVLAQLGEARETHLYRCPDCPFEVRVTRPEPGELYRWRLAASSHPHHLYQP